MLRSRSHRATVLVLAGVAAVGALASPLNAQSPDHELPLKYVGPPTQPAITAGDLMTRLYKFADDSMGGRYVGSEYNLKGTAYIAAEARRIGLKPAGDSGGYFQNLPLVTRVTDSAASTMTVGDQPFAFGSEFVAATNGDRRDLNVDDAIFVGHLFDPATLLDTARVRGKWLVVQPFQPPPNFNQQTFFESDAAKAYQRMLTAAAGTMLVSDSVTRSVRNFYFRPTGVSIVRDYSTAVGVGLTPPVVAAMFGKPLSELHAGDVQAAPMRIHLVIHDAPRPLGRNVVAILPGSDPKLRGDYVVIGAHNDHVAPQRPVDHDSLRAFNRVARPEGAEAPARTLSADEWQAVNAAIDSLHKLHGGARIDSISNGADDDGTGSVSLLEIAEKFANAKVRPKRSLLFVWHAGEERGMWGSEYFTGHPTVPRDSLVAEINLDMVGRGSPSDITGQDKEGNLLHGDTKYVQLVGSRRLSTELGDLIETVNRRPSYGFRLDYSLDADGHPENVYCRSDHAMYAAWGIPVAFFTTGGHQDYHQVTDEPQYIRYDHMALLDNMIADVVAGVADLDHRVVVDKPKPKGPHGACQQ